MNALPLVSVIVQFATNPVTIAMYSLIHHTLSPVVHMHTLSPVVYVNKMCIV